MQSSQDDWFGQFKKLLLLAFSTTFPAEKADAKWKAAALAAEHGLSLEEAIARAAVDQAWGSHFQDLRKKAGDHRPIYPHPFGPGRSTGNQRRHSTDRPYYAENAGTDEKRLIDKIISANQRNECLRDYKKDLQVDIFSNDVSRFYKTILPTSRDLAEVLKEYDRWDDRLLELWEKYPDEELAIAAIALRMLALARYIAIDANINTIQEFKIRLSLLPRLHFSQFGNVFRRLVRDVDDISSGVEADSKDRTEAMLAGLPEKRRRLWRRIIQLIDEGPHKTLREIAVDAECSPTTVALVRKRLGRDT